MTTPSPFADLDSQFDDASSKAIAEAARSVKTDYLDVDVTTARSGRGSPSSPRER
jgi:hypothetical protein